MAPPTLYGLEVSVYTRIARLAALEKGVALEFVPVDPFAPGGPPDWYRALQPFGKVPALRHGGFTLHETLAIASYLDQAFPGPSLQPAEPAARARMLQLVGIVDAYAYRPMVWGLYVAISEGTAAAADLAAAEQASAVALAALERLATGPFLQGEQLTLADAHLAPVLAYLAATPPGRRLMATAPRLMAWWQRVQARAGWTPFLAVKGVPVP